MELRIRDLGLAAFVEMQGRILPKSETSPVFKQYDERTDEYVFEDPTGKSEDNWRTEYYSDRCSVHDEAIMRLRKFKQSRRR